MIPLGRSELYNVYLGNEINRDAVNPLESRGCERLNSVELANIT